MQINHIYALYKLHMYVCVYIHANIKLKQKKIYQKSVNQKKFDIAIVGSNKIDLKVNIKL